MDAETTGDASVAVENGETFGEFLARIGGSLKCPRCGNGNWWSMNRGSQKAQIEEVGSHHLMVQTVACSRCGLIERYVKDIMNGEVKTSHE